MAQYQTAVQRIEAIDNLIAKSEGPNPGARNPGSMFSTDGRLGAIAMPPVQREQSSLSMSIRQAFAHATPEEKEQLQAFTSALRGNIQAAANLVPSSDGGYLIPSLVQAAMERSYSAFNPVVQVARLFATDNGDPMTFPVLSDSDTAAQLAPAAATGADATVSGDAPPTALTGPKLGSYKVSSKPVFVNRELITDGVGGIDIITEILGALLARVIRFENSKYTKGNGTSEAEGFMTNCSTYAAGSVPIDLDIALDLVYACPALYRPQGVYMMSDTTCKYLRKIKTGISGDKQLLWADADYTKGTPLTLHGYPVYINNDMDSVNADGTFTGKSPLAFGDFKRFVVRQAEQNRPFIYRYSVPAKDGQAVILFRRSDSKLLVATAIYRLIN
ncbi:MAG TPA: phage major capsid protein [Terriglobales bacterium]